MVAFQFLYVQVLGTVLREQTKTHTQNIDTHKHKYTHTHTHMHVGRPCVLSMYVKGDYGCMTESREVT